MKEVDSCQQQSMESLDGEEKPEIKALGVHQERDAATDQTAGKNHHRLSDAHCCVAVTKQTIALICDVEFCCPSTFDITVQVAHRQESQ